MVIPSDRVGSRLIDPTVTDVNVHRDVHCVERIHATHKGGLGGIRNTGAHSSKSRQHFEIAQRIEEEEEAAGCSDSRWFAQTTLLPGLAGVLGSVSDKRIETRRKIRSGSVASPRSRAAVATDKHGTRGGESRPRGFDRCGTSMLRRQAPAAPAAAAARALHKTL